MKKWIKAARLRTLPLGISGVLAGTAIAFPKVDWFTFLGCIFTAIFLQVLSNFANDYGDFEKGTDNDNRVGPARTMQLGLISKQQMKQTIITTAICCFAIAILTLLHAQVLSLQLLIFVVIGLLSIYAAITYTMGKNAYGYKGLGDVFVFIFFGLVSVLGTKFLIVKEIVWSDWLIGASIGFLSSAVLNLNNMRDIENDKQQGKNTIVTKMGIKRAFIYHHVLIFLGIDCAFAYTIFNMSDNPIAWLSCLMIIPFAIHLLRINKKGIQSNFDPELKVVALSTFAFSLLLFLQEYFK